jgi:outer membrane protein OmpA-like peptidoglycan-associated protein
MPVRRTIELEGIGLNLSTQRRYAPALISKGMKLPCTATGVGSSKPLVSPQTTAAEKQRNRQVLVQIA